MRILQVISHYVPAYRFGGPLQVAHSLGRALIERGHAITVCCTSQETQTEDLKVPLDVPVRVDGIDVYYQKTGALRRWGYAPEMKTRLKILLREVDAVVIHSHYQYAGWLAGTLARRRKIPYVVYTHGSLKRDSLKASRQIPKKLYLSLLESRNFRQAKALVFNAEEELENSLFADKGVVIPNAISPGDFATLPERGQIRGQLPQLDQKQVFLFLGRVDILQKGVDILLQAFARHHAESPNSFLVIAGPSEGRDISEVQEMVVRLNLRDHVLFTGLLDNTAKKKWLRDADVFVMPSRYEGLSISLLEAMASGLPVILSRKAGLHRQVDRFQCGITIEPEVENLYLAMQSMTDEGFRTTCGTNGRALILREHTWPVVAEKLEALLIS
jgi:glycosyltransferase involved in cell wall biosynthesis